MAGVLLSKVAKFICTSRRDIFQIIKTIGNNYICVKTAWKEF